MYNEVLTLVLSESSIISHVSTLCRMQRAVRARAFCYTVLLSSLALLRDKLWP